MMTVELTSRGERKLMKILPNHFRKMAWLMEPLSEPERKTLVRLLNELGAQIVATTIVPDDLDPLAETLRAFADRADVNLVITTGGTGFAPRDNTPEATLSIVEREAPGLAEAMRMETLKQTPMAMISRGVCGIRSGTLIVNLPGSPKAVRESFAVIAPVLNHAIALLAGKPTTRFASANFHSSTRPSWMDWHQQTLSLKTSRSHTSLAKNWWEHFNSLRLFTGRSWC